MGHHSDAYEEIYTEQRSRQKESYKKQLDCIRKFKYNSSDEEGKRIHFESEVYKYFDKIEDFYKAKLYDG